jgi:hypothetical protein
MLNHNNDENTKSEVEEKPVLVVLAIENGIKKGESS